jgi:hypothetical protein
MRRSGKMVLILLGAVTLLGTNDALAQRPHGDMRGTAQFDAMDTDKDGKISAAEYTAKCQNRFKAMDTDHDGFLTRDEWQKRWDEGKGKMKKGHSYRQPTTAPPQE